MEEIKVEEYVISQNRLVIGKIIEINEEEQKAIIKINDLKIPIGFWNIKKHSKNIIDLIEIGDYVNGKKVNSIGTAIGNFPTINHDDGTFTTSGKIKTILTKEQYMQNCYKLDLK